MLSIGQGFGRVVQVAYLVEDMDAAMEHWLAQAGLGPWTCFRNIELEAVFGQRELTLRIHEGLAYMGDLQIQLVQSLNDPTEPTPYQTYLETRRFGVHHMAFFSEDIEADVARASAQGFGRTCSMRDKAGYRYYYCQSTALPDVWIEFLEVYPELTRIFQEGIAAAASWNGKDPIRNIEYADL
jgi:hypothetical protein